MSGVRAILGDVEAGASPCSDVRVIVRMRLSAVEEKINYLSRIRMRPKEARQPDMQTETNGMGGGHMPMMQMMMQQMLEHEAIGEQDASK